MSIWTWIIVGCFVVLVLYLVLDKLIMPVIRHRRNQTKAAHSVLGTFFDPTSNFPERCLCELVPPYFVKPPKDHEKWFPKGEGKDSTPMYSLLGTQAIGQTPEGKMIEKPIRASVRDRWPLDTRESEQVLVEAGYWVKGRMQALNPYNDFLPVNTDKLLRTLKDEQTASAFAKVSQSILENWETIESSVKKIASSMKWIMIIVAGGALFSGVAAIIAYMVMKKVG